MDEQEREKALGLIKVPAIGLIITGIIGLLWGIQNAVTFDTAEIDRAAEEAVEQQQNEEAAEMTKKIIEGIKTVGMPLIILGILGGALVAFGGFSMLKGKSRGMAILACIVAMIPVISNCCPLGLVFGIWGLIALSKPEVKALFSGGEAAIG